MFLYFHKKVMTKSPRPRLNKCFIDSIIVYVPITAKKVGKPH